MTITDKLEGLLPADGNLTTKDERIIAEAVQELREQATRLGNVRAAYTIADASADKWNNRACKLLYAIPLAFATGCIASAIFVVLV